MDSDAWKQSALRLIDDYLSGRENRVAVWRWAQEVIISKDWEKLPADIQDAIHGLWLLHDNEGSWVPDKMEIRRIRDQLAQS